MPRTHLPSAVALNSVGFNLTRSVGPAIGGAIVAAFGAAAAFAVNAMSYFALIAVLLRWQPELPERALPRERLGAAMGAGLRYVAMSPNILKVLLRAFFFGATSIAVLALLPLVARHLVQGGPLVYGALLGAFGVGAVGGAFLQGRLRSRLSSEAIVRLAFAGFAVCALGLAWSPSAWTSGLATMIGGACWVLALSLFNVTVQLSTPRWVVGRALALYQTAAFGGMALGSWLWGTVAEAYDPATALICAATAMLVGGAIGLLLPLPGRAELNLDPLNQWQEPPVSIDIRSRSGPIQIEVEFSIARGGRARLPRADGRAPPHPHPRRRPPLDAPARSRRREAAGSRATRRRPGSTTCATTTGAPMPTPR